MKIKDYIPERVRKYPLITLVLVVALGLLILNTVVDNFGPDRVATWIEHYIAVSKPMEGK